MPHSFSPRATTIGEGYEEGFASGSEATEITTVMTIAARARSSMGMTGDFIAAGTDMMATEQ